MIQKVRNIVNERGIQVNDIPTKLHLQPEKAYYPVTNGRCSNGDIFINEGDYVKVGQIIGKRQCGFFDQNIHSTVSGTYVGVKKMFYRKGKKVDCIVIENDMKDAQDQTNTNLSFEEILSLSNEEVFDLVKENSVVGLGGSGFPNHIKLKTTYNIDTVILNGVECEPYLTSDTRMLKEEPEKIIEGLIILKKFFNSERAIVTVKEDKYDLIETLNKAASKYSDFNIEIIGVPNYYPQGYEKEVIKSVLGMKIPVSELPTKYGVMVINSTTSGAILDAVKYNTPILDRYFLVSGDGVNQPTSFKARIGGLVSELIEASGGYKENGLDKSLIIGGPMMGSSVVMDSVVISKAASSALVLNVIPEKEETCVRCGSCVYTCPVDLSPVQIMNAAKSKNKEAAKGYNALNCMECGLCTYVCTSKIHVTEWIRKAKPLAR